MQVRETTLKELVQGQKQFRVPLWQRQYTWKRRNHQLLWSDILEQYDALKSPVALATTGHFLGSFVLSPGLFPASGVGAFLIVDGQQRLTTLLLLLCAMRDARATTEPGVVERINELYLINKWNSGLERMRLLPTQVDRASFQKCVDGEPGSGGQDGIGDAYRFFRSQIELGDIDGDHIDFDLFERVIVEQLKIVDITTGAGDNAHRIFQSLNGTGVKLTQADLIRNYIFMLLPSNGEEIYERVWRALEEKIGFANLEGLARVALQCRGIEVSKDDVYRQHQERLDAIGGDETAVEEYVRDLARRADHYARVINPTREPDEVLRASLARLARWGAQTSYPLLMHGYDLVDQGRATLQELRDVALYIESFLARRLLIGTRTNALNKIFVALIPQLPPEVSFAEGVRQELSRERRYWATDAQIHDAVRTRPFYFTGAWNQQFLILQRLEESYDHPEPVDFAHADLTIEHIMPQTVTSEWRDHLTELGQKPDEVHVELLHTLGNLTLTGSNSELSNNPFARKQELYANSHLELNRELPELPAWGRDQILARAEQLATRIINIWPAPLRGYSQPADGFDWSTINAAVAAVPGGRWTSYGDLAQLGGTAPVPVGQHLASGPVLTNAYRVLGADGVPRPNFRWPDENDEREVIDVLRSEGVSFDTNGVADPQQRVRAEELATLLEPIDADADEGDGAPEADADEPYRARLAF